MTTLLDVLRAVHVVTAVLMAWPFYALVAVNQRARLGPPLGDRTDTYMENIIKNRTVPCLVFQATVLITGLLLMMLRGVGLRGLLSNPVLGTKFGLLLLISALLLYVHSSVQPRIDALFSQSTGGEMASETARTIGALRLRRKRLASICLFSVLTMAALGVQVWEAFSPWVTAMLLVAIAVFTRRAYATTTPYGWA